MTETYILSTKVDQNGRRFVLTSRGQLVFGEITPDTGLKAAPILLSEGIITNQGTNDGYGLIHIEARHGDQIRKAGYRSVIDFIEGVAKNYETIRKGKRRNGAQTYMVQLVDTKNNTLIVELSADGIFWNINTAGVFRTSYGVNNNVVYNRPTSVKRPAEAAGATRTEEQSSTLSVPSRSNTPTQHHKDSK